MIKKKDKTYNIIDPKDNLNLFGYNEYFANFIKLFENKNLPQSILLSGIKGSGKSTFFYHFINYIFSKDEENKYNLAKKEIDPKNKSYNLMQNFVHPNFFLLQGNALEENIKVDHVRELLKFIGKSTYKNNLKFILINNTEFLNINSSNALLKCLEEPPENTYFFIIHNNFTKISDTIKSRCLKFNIHFNVLEKKNIFNNISQSYSLNFDSHFLDNFIYNESAGNILKYLIYLNIENQDLITNFLNSILYFTKKLRDKKDSDLINFTKTLIEKFYSELALNNSNYIIRYENNKKKINKLFNEMKEFNLDKKNLLTTVDDILINES